MEPPRLEASLSVTPPTCPACGVRETCSHHPDFTLWCEHLLTFYRSIHLLSTAAACHSAHHLVMWALSYSSTVHSPAQSASTSNILLKATTSCLHLQHRTSSYDVYSILSTPSTSSYSLPLRLWQFVSIFLFMATTSCLRLQSTTSYQRLQRLQHLKV